MIINSAYDVDIKINGVSILGCGNAIGVKCAIIEDIKSTIPMCNLEFYSSPDFLGKLAIVDGTPIVITLNMGEKIQQVFNFRVTKLIGKPEKNLFYYAITGLIDFYELFQSASPYAQNSSSSDLFKNIAEKFDLYAIIHQTYDKQLWTSSEQNLGKWLTNVSTHGWASNTSAMVWFLDKTKKLYYIDIDRLMLESSAPVLFSSGLTTSQNMSTGMITFGSMTIETNSGDENLFNNGYGGENRFFSITDYKWHNFSPNKIRASSNIININKELSNGLEDNFCEFDMGNYHNNYFLARDQNARILSTYSTYFNLNCEWYHPIFLGQFATIGKQSLSSEISVSSFNNKCFVSGIKTFIDSTNVSMHVTLCSQGYNGYSEESY